MNATPCKFLAAALLLAFASSALAAVHYVDVNSTNATPPYTGWATAATNIQDAVDAAVAGDEVVVTNGVYSKGNGSSLVFVYKALNLRSVNGPQVTIITNNSSGFVRCVALTNYASLCGFTLTGGRWPGAGGGLNSYPHGYASNCIIAECRAYGGAGAFGGTLLNCTLSNNVAGPMRTGYTNTSYVGGGAASCQLINCVLVGNSAGVYPGDGRGFGGGAYYCTLSNCTLVGNSATEEGGAWYWYQEDWRAHLHNCIRFGNHGGPFLCEDCDSPGYLVSNDWLGDPLLADTNGWADLRLQSNSPCINAGNNSYLPNSNFTNCFDLDRNPRIVGGTVDIGAYEFQSPPSMISYAWLQRYGLPINASTDTADPDGDGVDNFHEWLAGTNPTNSLSSPAQLAITPSGVPPSGIILTWSTNAVGFTLQSTTKLDSSAVWSTNSAAPVAIDGQNTVTNSISVPQHFYRLVQ